MKIILLKLISMGIIACGIVSLCASVRLPEAASLGAALIIAGVVLFLAPYLLTALGWLIPGPTAEQERDEILKREGY